MAKKMGNLDLNNGAVIKELSLCLRLPVVFQLLHSITAVTEAVTELVLLCTQVGRVSLKKRLATYIA